MKNFLFLTLLGGFLFMITALPPPVYAGIDGSSPVVCAVPDFQVDIAIIENDVLTSEMNFNLDLVDYAEVGISPNDNSTNHIAGLKITQPSAIGPLNSGNLGLNLSDEGKPAIIEKFSPRYQQFDKTPLGGACIQENHFYSVDKREAIMPDLGEFIV